MNAMPIIQTLMNSLKVKAPQNYQTINALMQSNGNPMAIVQQLMRSATPQQKEALFKQCKQYNVPENILSQIQNMK